MCGVCTVTILSSLMPPGLATRHSAVFRHEEAPAWVSRAWTSLSLLAHGVILATNVNILIQATEEIPECIPEKLSKMLLCSITIFGFLSPLLLKNGFEYLRETLDNNEFQCCDGNCQDKPYVQDLASWVFWKRKEVTNLAETEKETLQLTKFMENIPSIEITSSDGDPSYVSFAEVDQSNIEIGEMTPVGTPSGDFPDQNPILDIRVRDREKTKTLSFSEPFVSLTSFDARTRPGQTHIPGVNLILYLIACSLYNISNGFQLGQNVQKIDTEVEPVYMLELVETSLVSFSMGIILITRDEYLSVISIFCWMLSASSFHLVGAIIGVSLQRQLFCIKTLLATSQSLASGLLFATHTTKYLTEDLDKFQDETFINRLLQMFILLLGSILTIILKYFIV